MTERLHEQCIAWQNQPLEFHHGLGIADMPRCCCPPCCPLLGLPQLPRLGISEDLVEVIYGFLLVPPELVALGCGIAARCTATGKAGRAISAGSLLLLLLYLLVSWIVFRSEGEMPPPAFDEGPKLLAGHRPTFLHETKPLGVYFFGIGEQIAPDLRRGRQGR